MARGPFHFKAFSVEQDGAAMKVGTDGIVLGCWTEVDGVRTIVDAGAGNGYVGIMLMQRMTEGKVIGCELEPDAAKQAAENYAEQPFEGKTGIAWEGAIQDAASAMPDLAGTVDLMISNPPFFRDKPKSPIRARNLARHDDTLTPWATWSRPQPNSFDREGDCAPSGPTTDLTSGRRGQQGGGSTRRSWSMSRPCVISHRNASSPNGPSDRPSNWTA